MDVLFGVSVFTAIFAIVDPIGNIPYSTPSLRDLLKRKEFELRKEL